MKILIIGNGAISNSNEKYTVNKHTAKFTEELLSKGVDIGFLQFEEKILENRGLQDSTLNENIKIFSLEAPKEKLKKIISYIKMVFLIKKTIKKYDFIYIFYPGHVPVITSILSKILGKKYGLYIRGQHNLTTKVGGFIIKHAEFCLTVSDLLKTELLIKNNNCETIAPMIDFSKKDILSSREYSKDNILRCLFVGRVEFRKGIYDLIEAIKILNKKQNNLHFDIVGGGDSFNELSNQFKNIKNVNFIGQISDKTELLAMYRQADLFIFPSHDEGFPRVLYEAMMARVPVLTTMVGGIGGFMKDHHNCIAINAQNPDSIVNGVIEIINSKELKMNIVDQATEDVKKLFNGTREKHSVLLINKLERNQ